MKERTEGATLPPKTIAIIQARQGSHRFPGKVLARLQEKPILQWVCERVAQARHIDEVVVATTEDVADDEIVFFCSQKSISCFRGPMDDVLRRYRLAAEKHGAETVVRVTADCPLIDPVVIDQVVEAFQTHSVDYASNTLRSTFPDGLDCEVFSYASLVEADEKASLPEDREHVTPYLKKGKFRRHSVENGSDQAAQLRITVDYPEDLIVIDKLCEKLSPDKLNWESVMQELIQNESLSSINKQILANEGYYRTLGESGVSPLGYRLDGSVRLFEKTKQIIPDASQTFSKGRSQVSVGASPFFVERGEGAYLWDVDGNRYLDYTMGLGPCILGYSDPDVNAAAHAQIDKLTIASLSSPLERELAETLIRLIPCAEMVRFGKNGSDVTAAAVRIARAYTKRSQILCSGYHGWQDWYIGTTTRSLGVPKEVAALTDTFKFNDLASLERQLEKYRGNVAAVVVEPVAAEAPKANFLNEVIALAHRHGALVIFDEVITGFRFHLGGAQALYNATPDIACFGKAMANGYPLSAVVGRAEVMGVLEDIFFSFTMGGEMVSLAAARATIAKLESQRVLPSIAEQGRRLMDGITVLSKAAGVESLVTMQGTPPRSLMLFNGVDEEEGLVMKTYFQQECVARGLLFSGSHFISYAHTPEVIDHTLKIYSTVFKLLKENRPHLRSMVQGEILKPVFRKP